jgi:hypothetical protein
MRWFSRLKAGELHLRSYKKTIKEAQVIIGKYIPDRERSFVVDELIEQRRREAERE